MLTQDKVNHTRSKSLPPAAMDGFAIAVVLLAIVAAIVLTNWAFDATGSLTITPSDFVGP